jgi:hypothetical protein
MLPDATLPVPASPMTLLTVARLVPAGEELAA